MSTASVELLIFLGHDYSGVHMSCHPEERGISPKVAYVRGKDEIPRTLGMTR